MTAATGPSRGSGPAIFFTLNDVKKATWEECYEALEGKAAAEYQRHGYLAQSNALTEQERAQFLRVSSKQESRDDVESSLRQLALYLRKHYNRRVVVLIDEYDAPVMAGHEKGYYRQVVDFMKGWLTGALKDGGAALDLACLTGVQRIAKESIFSDLNNLTVDTALDTESEERFGFTEKEVAALASYLGYPHKRDEVKYWYDGYRFGDADIYNPWTVLQTTSPAGAGRGVLGQHRKQPGRGRRRALLERVAARRVRPHGAMRLCGAPARHGRGVLGDGRARKSPLEPAVPGRIPYHQRHLRPRQPSHPPPPTSAQP